MDTQALAQRFTDVLGDLGLECIGVEFTPAQGQSTLRVYLDVLDQTTEGREVTLDDCEAASRELSALLDVEDPVPGHYVLEVSSPGMDRRLFTFEQFDLMKGSQVKLKLNKPFDGKKRFTGLLVGTEDKEVVLRVGEEETLFPYEMIDRANVVPEI